MSTDAAPESVQEVQTVTQAILAEMRKAIVGQDEPLLMMLVALLCRGHLLFEGVPGTAKTLMVRVLAQVLSLDSARIQFTPDLMPSDVVGTNVFNLKENAFVLSRGPVFTNLLLADEINRTPAKTQSALLECMEERHCTIDGVEHPLADPFMVLATQNPVEYEGTYPLPEAQLDRFLLKVVVQYPSAEEEENILRRAHEGFDPLRLDVLGLVRVADAAAVARLCDAVGRVRVEPKLIQYIQRLVAASRTSPAVQLGASPRAAVHLLRASKALAAVQGRDFITPDHVKTMALPVLRHRLLLQPEVEVEGTAADDVVRTLFDQVEVPR